MKIDANFKRKQREALKAAIGEGRIIPIKRRSFTPKQRDAIFEAYEGKCADCGMSCHGRRWDGDHIIPLFRGGKHEMANWQLLCAGPDSCHENKTGLEAPGNAKIRRIEDRELNGPKPATLKSRSEWPKGQKLQSRARPWGYQAREGR